MSGKRKRWRTAVLLNSGAGTLKGSNVCEVANEVQQFFTESGHEASVTVTTGPAMAAIIDRHRKTGDIDAIIIGGGDGSVSSAASRLHGSGIALGVLPLGTMNLYARSLAMPLTLAEALAALAEARPKPVDAGFIGERLFLHQLSLGLHPELVKRREKMAYRSRFGKILASVRAYVRTLRRPRLLTLNIEIDGKSQLVRTPALVVSNNLYGDNYLPYAAKLDEGILGLYVCTSRRWPDLIKLTADVMLGTWPSNPCIETFSGRKVIIESVKRRRPITASIDGELVPLGRRIEIKIAPRALKVLMPRHRKTTLSV
jgi:diacylglycerol kinase family enzyme